jgi:hypothetical protein
LGFQILKPKSPKFTFKSLQICNSFQKKKEKKKALRLGISECMQAFRLKNFPEQDNQPEQEMPWEKFYAKPGGIELARTKDKPLTWLDFLKNQIFNQFSR